VQTQLGVVVERKGATVHSVSPTAKVLEAVRRMNQERIGALLVRDGDRVMGIFTERDVLTRVVDPGRDPATTPVAEVMTSSLVTVGPATTVAEAMAVVTEKRCRHLPVMDGERLVGLVSIGDLTRWVTRRQAWHIEDLVRYIVGSYPV
jgi:CBS domain-containing protein